MAYSSSSPAKQRWRQAGFYAKAAASLRTCIALTERRQAGPSSHFRGHGTYLRKLRVGVRMKAHVLTGALSNARVNVQKQESERMILEGRVVVETRPEDAPTEFWQQGDASMYTKDALRQREALRRHPLVTQSLSVYWETAVRSMQAHRDAAPDLAAPSVGFHSYTNMLRNIYKSLLDEWDPQDAEEAIAEDWERDRRGSDGLNRQMLMDSLFELADMWTSGVNPKDYSGFLESLYNQVSVIFEKKAPGSGEVLWKGRIWRHADECAHDPSAFPRGVFEADEGDDLASLRSGLSGRSRRSQSSMSSPDDRRSQRRDKKARERAAIKIQASARGKMARKMARRRDEAARMIGTIAKGKVTRMSLSKEMSKPVTPPARIQTPKSVYVSVPSRRSLYAVTPSTPGTKGSLQPWALRPVETPVPFDPVLLSAHLSGRRAHRNRPYPLALSVVKGAPQVSAPSPIFGKLARSPALSDPGSRRLPSPTTRSVRAVRYSDGERSWAKLARELLSDSATTSLVAGTSPAPSRRPLTLSRARSAGMLRPKGFLYELPSYATSNV